MKTLVIADIHGCHAELMDLLERAALTSDDLIISLGDIVDRGHGTAEVLRFFRTTPRAQVVLGNHERKHVKSFHGEVEASLSQRISRAQIGEADYPDACAWMAGLPSAIVLPQAVLVHAMFEPGIPLEQQKEAVLAGTMRGERYLQKKDDTRPWYERYDGELPIIVGHHNIEGGTTPYIRKDGRVIGLDTTCYAGGPLNGLLLPDFKLVSVPSRGNHWSMVKAKYSALQAPSRHYADLPFDKVEALATDGQSQRMTAKKSERLEHLQRLLDDTTDALAIIHAEIISMHDQIVAKLQDISGFGQLNERGKARLFSDAIHKPQLVPLLHLQRRGMLTPDSLKKHLRTPQTAISLARLLQESK